MKYITFENSKIDYKHNVIDSKMVQMPDGTYQKQITLDVIENENERYEVVAIMDHSYSPKGNLIRHLDFDVEIPKRFRHTDGFCECCNHNRDRTHLYLVLDKTDGSIHQLGSSCVKKYVGLDPREVESSLKMMEKYSEFNHSCFKKFYKLSDIVALSIASIDKHGYRPASEFGDCTKSDVIELNLGVMGTRQFGYNSKDELIKSLTPQAEKVIAYWNEEVKDDTEFHHNIKLICSEGYISRKGIGIAAYLYQGYRKEMDRREKQRRTEEMNAKVDFFGEIKKRYRKMEVEKAKILCSWASPYGYNTEIVIYEIILKGINGIFIWKTSNAVTGGDEISFTVKDHKIYKGVKQTEITRVRVELQE